MIVNPHRHRNPHSIPESAIPNRIAMRLFIAATVLFPLVLAAQETPTERAAAPDVVKKLGALQQSLDVPALVARLTAANATRDAVAARAKELMDSELLAMADDI